jgi:hypothetical protein
LKERSAVGADGAEGGSNLPADGLSHVDMCTAPLMER